MNTKKHNQSSDIVDIPGIAFQLSREYVVSHTEELGELIRHTTKGEIMDELVEIKRQMKKPVVAIEQYAKTQHAAALIDVDPSFLTKRQGSIFVLGKHFFKPEGESIVRWSLEALEEWLTSLKVDDTHIDKKLASLLERS